MNNESVIKSLNFTMGEVLTLEKAQDRMEFEALPVMSMSASRCGVLIGGNDNTCECKGIYEKPCTGYCDPDACNGDVPIIGCPFNTCDCVGPKGYKEP